MNEGALYYFMIALFGSSVLIYLAKYLLCKPMRKRVDYYEEAELEEEMRMLDAANLRKSPHSRKKKGGKK